MEGTKKMQLADYEIFQTLGTGIQQDFYLIFLRFLWQGQTFKK